MASLKEVKNRISSVRTTRKITSARGMVASAKLRRAQQELAGARAYRDGLRALWGRFVAAFPELRAPLAQAPTGPLAVIAIGSDAGMAGAFNALIEREEEHNDAHAERHAIGAKIGGTLPADQLWAQLMERYHGGALSGVEVVYHDFRTMSAQSVVRERLLPFVPPAVASQADAIDPAQWIIEPSPEALAAQLREQLIEAEFRAVVASSHASEQVARMMAMQAATDNADELLDELHRSYNKLRQQNITAELLDIIGSSFA